MASKWFELGAELLDEREEHKLDNIESNHHSDVNKCCLEMFRMWLKTRVNPTWTRIVEALESPGVQLLSVSADLKKLVGKIKSRL